MTGATTNPTVLLVDDEADVTEALRIAMRSEPFTVLTATSAEEGLSILRRRPVDVVVSDERMPGLTGAAFLTIVRSEFPSVRRIVLSGQASVEATIAAVNEARVFRFLTKPCPTDTLVACIVEALQTEPPIEPSDRAGLECDLTSALEAVRVVYQPLYSPAAGRVMVYEALVRSDHPAFHSPTELIEAVSVLDRHADFDRIVCNRVAADLAREPTDSRVFVNLLPQSLDDPMLLDESAPLRAFADRVGLEITERAPLDPTGPGVARLADLRGAGFQLVLDDLGAGYAGLTSFASLRPDVVKFDMGLIRDIDRSATQSRVVGSMVELCRSMGIVTVAEGIETQSELRHVIDLGCDLVQGYAIAKPGPLGAEVELGQPQLGAAEEVSTRRPVGFLDGGAVLRSSPVDPTNRTGTSHGRGPESERPPAASVLVVEDAPEFRQMLEAVLAREGYEVVVAPDGEQGLELAEEAEPTVVVLDLGLPGIDGIEVCRRLRTFSDAYVVMLTARDEEVDRLVGLAVGADDYMVKPFSPRELVARIQAMLRRPRSVGTGPADGDRREVGDLRVDLLAREVHVGDAEVSPTRIEFDLLAALIGRPDMVFSRQMLLEQVWGPTWVGDDHVVDVHIANLRRKIDLDGRSHIKTVRGVGYRLDVRDR